MDQTFLYPVESVDRDRWILERRPQRNPLDPYRPYDFLTEEELSHTGERVAVSTVFLTNKECPWRCVMCDLWKNTLAETVPQGAIQHQIAYALARLPHARQVKLYNAGSFFDSKAIPPSDYAGIASEVSAFERVIVESHPALIGERCWRLRDLVSGRLEVAIGLETVHPKAMEKLNKRVTREQFSVATARLRKENVALRVFVLVQPPFIAAEEAQLWTERTIEFAFSCHASAITLIPTRSGNGSIDTLTLSGDFTNPELYSLESALQSGLAMSRGRVFVDLWNIHTLQSCPECSEARHGRLLRMNLSQVIEPSIACARCGGSA